MLNAKIAQLEAGNVDKTQVRKHQSKPTLNLIHIISTGNLKKYLNMN